MRIALLQLCTGTDLDKNLEDIRSQSLSAADQGAEFILTPEGANLLQRDAHKQTQTLARYSARNIIDSYGEIAAQCQASFLAGSLILPGESGKTYNRSILFDRTGTPIADYNKIHLFDVDLPDGQIIRESDNYHAGNQGRVVDTDFGKLGLSICYDLRFPYLFRRLSQAGAQMISVPAAFTYTTGQAHWEILLRARAIETASFILAPAQGGFHEDGRRCWGHSMVISPWGEIIGILPDDKPNMMIIDIDLAQVDEIRHHIPSWRVDKAFELI